jgi:hypothetical protein
MYPGGIPAPWRGCDGCERTCTLRPPEGAGAALRPEEAIRLAPLGIAPPEGRAEPAECVAELIMRDRPLAFPPPPRELIVAWECPPPPGGRSSAARAEPAAASSTLAKAARATRRPPGTEIDAIFDMALLT